MARQMPIVQALEPSHYPAAGALLAAVHPARAGELSRWVEEDRLDGVGRWTVIGGDAERVEAYGALWRVQADRFRMDLIVDRGRRRCGLGSHMLADLSARARLAGASTLQARAEADAATSLAFLEHRGFGETMRMHRFVLDVDAAMLMPLADLENRLAADGVVMTTLEVEQREDHRCWEKLCDLHNAAQEGWPDPDPGGDVPPLSPESLQYRWARWAVAPDGVFLAKRGDQYLGFSGGTGTAVRPTARTQGIGTALKMSAVRLAGRHGKRTVSSNSGNPAMIRILEKIGYRWVSAEVRLVTRLDRPDAS